MRGGFLEWVIAFFHYPPSKGSHDSDREIELIETRERLLPILEQYGVDLVLTGHSHNYERSYLLDGHYGYSTNFSPAMILDSGDGRDGRDGPYQKPFGALGDRRGTVYVVCGCSGEGGATRVDNHPAMRVALGGYGSMVIEVEALRLDAKFLRPFGDIDDYFTIVKDNGEGVRPRINITRAGDKAKVIWPAFPPINLESVGALPWPASWRPVTNAVRVLGHRNITEVDALGPQQVFRLRQ